MSKEAEKRKKNIAISVAACSHPICRNAAKSYYQFIERSIRNPEIEKKFQETLPPKERLPGKLVGIKL